MPKPEFAPHDCALPDGYDPWRCRCYLLEVHNGQESVHYCAASDEHEGAHCCIYGTTWPVIMPRRTWRERLKRIRG